MPNKTDDTAYDVTSLWVRRTGVLASGFLLVSWLAALLAPKTDLDRFTSSIALIPFRVAGVVAEEVRISDIWTSFAIQPSFQWLAVEIISLAIFALVIWRQRALHILVAGSKETRLVSCALLSFSLLILIDLFTSSTTPYPFSEQGQYLLYLAFVFAFALAASARWWQFLFGIILSCIALESAYTINMYINGIDVFMNTSIIARATGTMSNPNYVYPICMMGVLLSIPLATSSSRKYLRLLFSVSAILSSIALMLTFSRAGGIGLVAGTIALAYQERKSRLRKVVMVLALIIAGYMMMARATTGTEKFGMDRAALGRIQIWRISTKIIRDNWLLGTGHNSYSNVQNKYLDARLEYFNPMNVDAKNQMLTMAAEHGVLGIAVFTLFVYATCAGCRSLGKKIYTPWERHMQQGIEATGIAILFASLTDTPMYGYMRFPGTFVWLCCMGFLLHLAMRSSPPLTKWRYSRVFRIGMAVLATPIILGFLTVITLGTVDAHHASRVFDSKIAETRNTQGFTPLKDIPKAMQDCVIADEDLYFYQHHGYSLVDMHRALRVNVRAGRVKQGGSTITQQLAKNLFFSHDRTIRRKVAEIIMAVRLEKSLSKEEILDTYLNTIDFAMPDSHGIRAAADKYFGKDASKLTDAECALLAGLIPSPPRKDLTPAYAKSAIHLTLRRLKNANPSRFISIQDELDKAGEDAWLSRHLST